MEKNKKQSNTIAIVGFILSFFIAIAGLICSIIGLVKSKELNNGKGFSIAGIIISSLRIVLTIILTIFAFLVVIDESKDTIDFAKDKIINQIEEKTEEEKAYNIIKTKWESIHYYSDDNYSYNYIGKYNNQYGKEFYVFNVISDIEIQNGVTESYYAVSIKDDDYYFIENSPEFLKTNIIMLEPKVVNYE